MKTGRKIITAGLIIVLLFIVAIRLLSNKRGFENELKMVSEFNTIIPIMTDTARYQNATREFSVNGSFVPFREISVVSESQGKVVSIAVETGSQVKSGQELLKVDNELLASQVEMAKFNLEKAEKDLKRFEVLSKNDAVTAQQFESAKQLSLNAQTEYSAARIQFANSTIKSPFDGIVTKQYIEIGTWLVPGAPVFDIVEISKVKLIARLTGSELENVKKGEAVQVTTDAWPGIVYRGVVNAVVVKADPAKRYNVEVVVNNQDDKFIKPGMWGSMNFAGQPGLKLLSIPRKAIIGSIKDPSVFLVRGDSVIERKISAVVIDDKSIAVSQGLNAGDVIVISGQINLVNGSKIKLTN
jgi:membrane fusion protein (multidrug efflux system)